MRILEVGAPQVVKTRCTDAPGRFILSPTGKSLLLVVLCVATFMLSSFMHGKAAAGLAAVPVGAVVPVMGLLGADGVRVVCAGPMGGVGRRFVCCFTLRRPGA